jgi:hypothetical protein
MFVFLWSLISPLCLGIIAGTLSLLQQSWHIGDLKIGLSIFVYAGYWLLLAMLQAAALWWRFQDRKLAIGWFYITAITGTLVMTAHDLALLLLGVDTRGQGIIILLLSLPCLGVVGSSILGAAQFIIIRSQIHKRLKTEIWFVLSFMSWAIGFGGIFASLDNISLLPLFMAAGTALKGLFIDKYLERSQFKSP